MKDKEILNEVGAPEEFDSIFKKALREQELRLAGEYKKALADKDDTTEQMIKDLLARIEELESENMGLYDVIQGRTFSEEEMEKISPLIKAIVKQKDLEYQKRIRELYDIIFGGVVVHTDVCDAPMVCVSSEKWDRLIMKFDGLLGSSSKGFIIESTKGEMTPEELNDKLKRILKKKV